MVSPLGIAVLHSLGVLAAWMGARFGTDRVRQTPTGRLAGWSPSQFARRVTLVTAVATACLAMVAGTDTLLTRWFQTASPGLGSDIYPTLSALALFLGPVPATAFAAYRGARTVARLQTADPPSLTRDCRRFVTLYAMVVGPALLVVALAPAIPDGWWLVSGIALVGFLLATATPLVVPRVIPTRELTPTERARFGVSDPIPVRVLDVGRYRNALAAGLMPGLRVVFVTERLLSTLPADETRAILAHELGHHRRYHVPLRLGAASAVVLPWLGATAVEIPNGFTVGLVLSGPAILGVLALMRWTERDADRYAARNADPLALARGLEHVCANTTRTRLAAVLATHPTPTARIDRARQLATDESSAEDASDAS